MRKNIFFLALMLMGVSFLTSCSKDDEEGANGDFNINGEAYSFYCGECSDGTNNETIDINTSFSMSLKKDGNIHSLVLRLANTYTLDGIKVGDNLIEKDIYVREFARNIGLSEHDYDDEAGEILVKSVSDKSITLEFKNFSFSKTDRNDSTETFTVNGTAEYRIVPSVVL